MDIIKNKTRLKEKNLIAIDVYCGSSHLESKRCSIKNSYILFKCKNGYIFEDKKGKY